MKKDRKDRRRARAWLVEMGIRQVSIQRDLQHKQFTQVNETLQGVRDNRRVLQRLIELGCPREFLALPKEMSEETL